MTLVVHYVHAETIASSLSECYNGAFTEIKTLVRSAIKRIDEYCIGCVAQTRKLTIELLSAL